MLRRPLYSTNIENIVIKYLHATSNFMDLSAQKKGSTHLEYSLL